MGLRGLALALLLAGPAAAGPIRVQVGTGAPEPEPFLVRVTGHYADLHNGYSRHWRDALVPSGRRHILALGPVNPLLNMGVSVTLYHPAYVVEHARSRKTPLLVRPVGFETFRPRPWRDVMEVGDREVGSHLGVPAAGLVAQLLGHLQLFVGPYLAALDESERPPEDARLRAYLPLFDQLVAYAASQPDEAEAVRWARGDPALARNLAAQALEQRAELREWLRRSHAWLGVPRRDRLVVRGLMQRMHYPKTVAEELMTEADRARLGDFLDRYQQDREARREPESATSWVSAESRVEYRVRVLDPPRACAYLSIVADLTGVVAADLGGMTNVVRASFCRRASGEWGYPRS